MELVTKIQILDKIVYISFYANALGKAMNLSPLSPAIGKIVGQARFF